MTATTFACSTVASSSANSAAHRYDPGARPSSSNWTDYVVSLYDPTVDNENEEPCPEICLILGDAAAGPERGPKDATTQRFTDVSATVPRKECDLVPRKDCDSTGAVDGILKVGAEVLGVPRPVPKRPPSPESSCGSDDPDPTGTSLEREEGEAPQLLGDIELNPQGFAKLAWQAEQARYISPYLPIARVAGRAGQGEG